MASMLNFQLPWEGLRAGGNALQGLGGDPQQAMANLGPMYAQQYQSALAMNEKNNENVQMGYGQLRSEADQVYQNIYKNLDARYSDVLGRIAGTNTSNINDIGRNAEALSGRASQQMVSRGLGNTTVQQNMQRAIESDRARETTRSNEAFAQLGAGYADRIWGDRTNAQQNKAQMMSGLGTQQLAAQERIQAGYPDAAMFGSLAQMYGAQSEADKNRKLQEAAMQRAGAGVQSAGGYSYSPSPWGSRNPAGSGGGAIMNDSWSSNFGNYGGGGSFYQPMGQGGNQTFARNYGDGGDYNPDLEGGGQYGADYYQAGDSGMSDAYLDEIGFY
jgi:hypothetical protein